MKYRKQFQEKVFSEQNLQLTVKLRGDVDFSVFEGENVCVQITGIGFRTYSGVARVTHVDPVVFKSLKDLGSSVYEVVGKVTADPELATTSAEENVEDKENSND